MSKCLLDTNVLVALVDTKDAHHKNATKIIEQIDSTVILPIIVVAEFLSGQLDATKSLLSLQKKWGNFIYTTEEELVIMAEFPQKIRKKLKANDCLILAHCLVHDANLITFDDYLNQAYLAI